MTYYIQDQLPFRGVSDNIIVCPGQTYALVITLSGVNINLMNTVEKRSLHWRLSALINLLEGYKFQFLALVETRDVASLLDELSSARDKETSPALREQSFAEADHIERDLVRGKGGIVSRQYFLVVRLHQASIEATDGERPSVRDEFLNLFGLGTPPPAPATLFQTNAIPPLVSDHAATLTETLTSTLNAIGFKAKPASQTQLETLLTNILGGSGQGDDFLDCCSPPFWNTFENYLQFGESNFVSGFYATAFPTRVSMGWLENLIKQPERMLVSLHIDLLAPNLAASKLSRKTNILQADEISGATNQHVERLRRGHQISSAFLMMDALAKDQEKVGFFSLHVLARANSLAELQRRSRRIEQKLRELQLNPAGALLHQDRFLTSCLPLAANPIASDISRRNGLTSCFAASVPNVVMDVGHESGLVLGVNKQDKSLVVLDRFKLTNYHKVIIAGTGSGKSVSEAIETVRGLLRGWQYIWFDPQNTLMPQLMNLTGGQIIDLGPDGGAIINPFDWSDLGENMTFFDDEGRTFTRLTEKVTYLTSLVQLMIERKLTAAEKSRLAKAIQNCYRDHPDRPPILEDLITTLQTSGMSGLVEELERFVDPLIFGHLFNGQTNVSLTNRCLSFNLRDLDEDQLRPVRVFQALEFVWAWILANPHKQKCLVIDEIGLLLHFSDIAQFVRNLYKRGRAFWLSVVAIDQNPDNFIENQFGRQMIENSSVIQLMKQNELGIESLQQYFKLTEGEVNLLLAAEPGEALLSVEGKRLNMKFTLSQNQLQHLSTRPEDRQPKPTE